MRRLLLLGLVLLFGTTLDALPRPPPGSRYLARGLSSPRTLYLVRRGVRRAVPSSDVLRLHNFSHRTPVLDLPDAFLEGIPLASPLVEPPSRVERATSLFRAPVALAAGTRLQHTSRFAAGTRSSLSFWFSTWETPRSRAAVVHSLPVSAAVVAPALFLGMPDYPDRLFVALAGGADGRLEGLYLPPQIEPRSFHHAVLSFSNDTLHVYLNGSASVAVAASVASVPACGMNDGQVADEERALHFGASNTVAGMRGFVALGTQVEGHAHSAEDARMMYERQVPMIETMAGRFLPEWLVRVANAFDDGTPAGAAAAASAGDGEGASTTAAATGAATLFDLGVALAVARNSGSHLHRDAVLGSVASRVHVWEHHDNVLRQQQPAAAEVSASDSDSLSDSASVNYSDNVSPSPSSSSSHSSTSNQRRPRWMLQNFTRQFEGSGREHCLVKNQGWWTYEWCHWRGMQQYHLSATTGERETGWSLGEYAGGTWHTGGTIAGSIPIIPASSPPRPLIATTAAPTPATPATPDVAGAHDAMEGAARAHLIDSKQRYTVTYKGGVFVRNAPARDAAMVRVVRYRSTFTAEPLWGDGAQWIKMDTEQFVRVVADDGLVLVQTVDGDAAASPLKAESVNIAPVVASDGAVPPSSSPTSSSPTPTQVAIQAQQQSIRDRKRKRTTQPSRNPIGPAPLNSRLVRRAVHSDDADIWEENAGATGPGTASPEQATPEPSGMPAGGGGEEANPPPPRHRKLFFVNFFTGGQRCEEHGKSRRTELRFVCCHGDDSSDDSSATSDTASDATPAPTAPAGEATLMGATMLQVDETSLCSYTLRVCLAPLCGMFRTLVEFATGGVTIQEAAQDVSLQYVNVGSSGGGGGEGAGESGGAEVGVVDGSDAGAGEVGEGASSERGDTLGARVGSGNAGTDSTRRLPPQPNLSSQSDLDWSSSSFMLQLLVGGSTTHRPAAATADEECYGQCGLRPSHLPDSQQDPHLLARQGPFDKPMLIPTEHPVPGEFFQPRSAHLQQHTETAGEPTLTHTLGYFPRRSMSVAASSMALGSRPFGGQPWPLPPAVHELLPSSTSTRRAASAPPMEEAHRDEAPETLHAPLAKPSQQGGEGQTLELATDDGWPAGPLLEEDLPGSNGGETVVLTPDPENAPSPAFDDPATTASATERDSAHHLLVEAGVATACDPAWIFVRVKLDEAGVSARERGDVLMAIQATRITTAGHNTDSADPPVVVDKRGWLFELAHNTAQRCTSLGANMWAVLGEIEDRHTAAAFATTASTATRAAGAQNDPLPSAVECETRASYYFSAVRASMTGRNDHLLIASPPRIREHVLLGSAEEEDLAYAEDTDRPADYLDSSRLDRGYYSSRITRHRNMARACHVASQENIETRQTCQKAMRWVGLRHLWGQAGFLRDDALASSLLTAAADAGDAEAMYVLGITSLGITEAVAYAHLRRSVDQRFPPAIIALAQRFFHGHAASGVEANVTRAGELFKRSAILGSPEGCFYLGILSQNGVGVPLNVTRALELFAAAAAQRHLGATWTLAKVRFRLFVVHALVSYY